MKKYLKINLDSFRIIAALLVISIHTFPLITINDGLDYMVTRVLARISVPFFLMITGYFIMPKVLKYKEVLVGYTKKILKLYTICILVYLPINIYSNNIGNLNFLKILKLILIDGTFYHLWYFPALLLGIWITYFILKKFNTKTVFFITFILYLIGLFGDSYYGIIKDFNILKSIYDVIFSVFSYTRNGLFYVPIFIYLGYSFNNKNYNITKKQNIIIIIISIILLELEGYILYSNNIQRHSSMYIFLIPVMFSTFNLLLNQNSSNRELRDLSTLIYIIHPISIIIVRGIAKIINIQGILIDNSIIHYIVVVIITLIISIIFIKLRNLLKQKNVSG